MTEMTANIKTQTPKAALIDILRAAKDECDDFVARFCEREDETFPAGDPLRFGKEAFAEWLDMKGIGEEDGAAWSEAVSRAWDLVTAVSTVADPDVERLHGELRESVTALEDLLVRANAECRLLECGR